MIVNKDFKFRDDLFDPLKDTVQDTVPIEILLAKFQGVVYKYSTVAISEQEDGTAKLRFTFEILEQPENITENLRTDSVFVQTIGMILNSLILDVVEGDDNGDKVRDDDPQEFDSERGLFSESSAVSET